MSRFFFGHCQIDGRHDPDDIVRLHLSEKFQKIDETKIQQRRTRRNTTFNVGDNYSKIETAMAKIEREGNHPDGTLKNWQTFSSCARMRRSC